MCDYGSRCGVGIFNGKRAAFSWIRKWQDSPEAALVPVVEAIREHLEESIAPEKEVEE